MLYVEANIILFINSISIYEQKIEKLAVIIRGNPGSDPQFCNQLCQELNLSELICQFIN